jgi:hypothetical protein
MIKKITECLLNVLGELNLRNKEILSKELDTNTEVTTKTIVKYSRSLSNYMLGVRAETHNRIAIQSEGHQRLEGVLNRRLDGIDLNNPESEIEEVELMRMKLENKAKLNDKVDSAISESNPLRDNTTLLFKACQAFGINRNKYLTKEYISNIKEGKAIEEAKNKLNSGSLIDDYANPSLEQPSYMDPED